MNDQHYSLGNSSTEIGGSGLPTSKNVLNKYEKMVDYLAEQISAEQLRYDISFDGDGTTLIYSRLFNDHIVLRSCSNSFNVDMLEQATNDREFVIPLVPKYKQLPYIHRTNTKSIIYLCGTNLLRTYDADQLKHILHRDIAVKFHPLTTRVDIADLTKNSKGCVIPTFVNSYETIHHFDKVYSASNSEMGLLAKLLGKDVVRVAIKGEQVCSHFYNKLHDFPEIVHSYASGIIRPDYYKEDIDGYLALYKELAKEKNI